jgi:hypothetical protein
MIFYRIQNYPNKYLCLVETFTSQPQQQNICFSDKILSLCKSADDGNDFEKGAL